MTTGTLPKPQHMDALDTANDLRLSRAAVRAELRAGKLSLREALDDPRAQGANIWKLIGHLPRWGTHSVNELSLKLIRQRVMIGYGARVQSLTERQRIALLTAVEKPLVPVKPKTRRTSAAPRRRPSPAPDPPLLEDPPPRCSHCRTRLLSATADGLCGFCRCEQAEPPALRRALEGRT